MTDCPFHHRPQHDSCYEAIAALQRDRSNVAIGSFNIDKVLYKVVGHDSRVLLLRCAPTVLDTLHRRKAMLEVLHHGGEMR